MNAASSLGFSWFLQAALTFLNQPAIVADAHAGLRQMWEASSGNGRARFTKSCAVLPRPANPPGKPAVPIPSGRPPSFIAAPSTPCPRNRQPGRVDPDGRERPVSWLPNHGGGTVRDTSINGVAARLEKVSHELDLLPEPMIKYLVPMSASITAGRSPAPSGSRCMRSARPSISTLTSATIGYGRNAPMARLSDPAGSGVGTRRSANTQTGYSRQPGL